jgi:hypothetical protein
MEGSVNIGVVDPIQTTQISLKLQNDETKGRKQEWHMA